MYIYLLQLHFCLDFVYTPDMRLIPKQSLVEITKYLHGNRDRGFEDEYNVSVRSVCLLLAGMVNCQYRSFSMTAILFFASVAMAAKVLDCFYSKVCCNNQLHIGVVTTDIRSNLLTICCLSSLDIVASSFILLL